ncbi:MAG: hypothetical protein NXI32_15655 [bacterium]|nr:hypothetical protein [bacterium]
MDWVDPKSAAAAEKKEARESGRQKNRPQAKSKKGKSLKQPKEGAKKSLRSHMSVALGQPTDVWVTAYAHALSGLIWPPGCDANASLVWSAIIEEQAQVLLRSGLPAKPFQRIFAHDGSDTTQDSDEPAGIEALMGEPLESLAFQWLQTADVQPHAALGIAAVAWNLPQLAEDPNSNWLNQWLQSLLDLLETGEPASDAAVLCHLVMQCELPLLLTVGTTPSRKLAQAEASKAMDFLAEHLEAGRDNPEPWLLYGATYLRAALACVLRCRVLADSLGLRGWYGAQQKALAKLLEHAARWSRYDGTQMLAAGTAARNSKAIWRALASQTRNSKSMSAAMTLSGIGTGKRSQVRREARVSNLPPTTYYSELASGGCMQCDWRQKGSKVAVDFSDSEMCIEALGPKGSPVLAGQWTVQVEMDGQAQLQLDEWTEVCWFSDDDVDYLELQAQFGQQAKLQRQAILFREEGLLYLADALICDSEAELSLRSQLPLAGGTSFEPADKTTEGFLLTESGGRCLTLPLYLPEWRRQLTISGEASCLMATAEDLLVQAESRGRSLYMPVLISLNHHPKKVPFTWRHLTVGDDLRIVRHDEARAFRIQIGGEQWFIYCNLSRPQRRTALSVHTMADFYAARFDAHDGEFDTIVEVDPPEQEPVSAKPK